MTMNARKPKKSIVAKFERTRDLKLLRADVPFPRLDQEPVGGDGDREHEHDQEER